MGQRVDGELLSYCCKCEVLRVASTAGCPPSLAYAMSRTIMCAHRIMYVNVFSIPSKWLGSRLEYGAFCSAGKGFVPSFRSPFSRRKRWSVLHRHGGKLVLPRLSMSDASLMTEQILIE
jgi:hypothetical protein